MSSYINKYEIYYDNNNGSHVKDYIYCKYNSSTDTQQWVNEDGSSINFDQVTDSYARVVGSCIAGVRLSSIFEYWIKVMGYGSQVEIPENIKNILNGD